MKIVAAINGTDVSGPVLDFAVRAADILGADVEAVHVSPEPDDEAERAVRERQVPLRRLDGPVAATLRTVARASDVAALVVGARDLPHGRRPAGHVTQELMTSLPGALVIVPPSAREARPIRRVLVALDGRPESAVALAPIIHAAAHADLEVIVVHVLDPQQAPPYADQPHHFSEAFAREFRARHVPSVNVAIELRAGDPPDRLLDAAKELDADLVALAWSQILTPDRAAVVQNAVADGELPVLLVPLATG